MDMQLIAHDGKMLDTIEFPSSMNYSRCTIKPSMCNHGLIKVPSFSEATTEDLEVWLGLVACNALSLLSPDHSIDPFVSEFESPQHQETMQVSSMSWAGFLSVVSLKQVIEMVQEALEQHRFEWAAVIVWGFPDSEFGAFCFHQDGTCRYVR